MYDKFLTKNINKIKEVKPFPDQAKALIELEKFKKDKNRREFCLSGRAGTGKSTIIRQFLGKTHKKYGFDIPFNVIGVTLSHKAKMNLMDSIPNSTTYASAVGLDQYIDDFGNIQFKDKKKTKQIRQEMAKYKWLAFDECSQVGPEMQEIIKSTVSPNCKIIYMGDHHQLPPIGVKGNANSPVFDIPGYNLTETIRQKAGDSILELSDIVCNEIDKPNPNANILKTLRSNYSLQNKKGYNITNANSVIKSYLNNPVSLFDKRITAFRKTTTAYYNQLIRGMLFDDAAEYTKGDFIVLDNQYVVSDGVFDIKFYNGQEFIVDKVYETIIEGFRTWEIHIGEDVPIYVVMNEDKQLLKNKLNQLAREAKLDYKNLKWGPFIALKSLFAEISHAYAVNNYKIQGSTLHTCYVDMSDILSVGPISDKVKLQAAYVGFSRPTHNLAIF